MHFEGKDREERRLACSRRTHDGEEISTIDLSTQTLKHNLISLSMGQTDFSPLEGEVIVDGDVGLFVYHFVLVLD